MKERNPFLQIAARNLYFTHYTLISIGQMNACLLVFNLLHGIAVFKLRSNDVSNYSGLARTNHPCARQSATEIK